MIFIKQKKPVSNRIMLIVTKSKVFLKFEEVCGYYLILYRDHPMNLINQKMHRIFHLMLKDEHRQQMIE
jgi:hypothetical protein